MMIAYALAVWLGLNYLLMARLAYVGLLRERVNRERALRLSLLWPLALLSRVRV